MPVKPLNENEKKALKERAIWNDDCPLKLERLVNVEVDYYDLEGRLKGDGEITVMDALSSSVEEIFKELLAVKFPITRIRAMEHYNGDDQLSMSDNNSSSFNCRRIAGSGAFSIHSYGAAIDLNPLQNPFLEIDEENGIVKVHPKEGWRFLNRRNQKPGMVEAVGPIFEKHGYTIWGGAWTTPVDYHHFQIPRVIAELMSAITPDDAEKLFELFKRKRESINQAVDSAILLEKYSDSPRKLFASLDSILFSGA